MNPTVRVAYEDNWWKWHNVILRIPVIKFWVGEPHIRIVQIKPC